MQWGQAAGRKTICLVHNVCICSRSVVGERAGTPTAKIVLSMSRDNSVAKEALTWVDPKTGLEWQMHSPGKMNWHEALDYAGKLSLNGKSDWRIPTAAELETLLDRTALFERIRPIMREEVPFKDTLSYWSSTTFAPNTYSAWIVMFDGAYILSYYKTNAYHVRCVRG